MIQMLVDCLELDPSTFVRVQVNFVYTVLTIVILNEV